MKATLFALRLNELLCCSAMCRRDERLVFSIINVIADGECHLLSRWVDSTPMQIQPASRIIHSSLSIHQRRGGIQLRINAKRRHNAGINAAGRIAANAKSSDEIQPNSARVE